MSEIIDNESVPPQLTAGIAYNLKKGVKSDVEDIEAEYDSKETIEAIKNALESAGISVVLLEADADFINKLKENHVDIVFNIAEGISGRGREAQVPAILSFLGIPYSGSDETTLCISLNKALTKRYLSTFGIKTPSYQLVKSPDFKLDSSLRFPLIVKPDAEGSSKGISDMAIVEDEKMLYETVIKNINMYKEPMLIEEYITGREFTVGILGNGDDVKVFDPMEICYIAKDRANRIYSYNVKKNYKKYITYSCPPRLPAETIQRMKEIAAEIYKDMECRDFSRIDFMLSDDGEIYFIEINPLPGLTPDYSDFPMIANFCGVDYRSLVIGVLNGALKRYGLSEVAMKRGA